MSHVRAGNLTRSQTTTLTRREDECQACGAANGRQISPSVAVEPVETPSGENPGSVATLTSADRSIEFHIPQNRLWHMAPSLDCLPQRITQSRLS
jgi:hypothetical protein